MRPRLNSEIRPQRSLWLDLGDVCPSPNTFDVPLFGPRYSYGTSLYSDESRRRLRDSARMMKHVESVSDDLNTYAFSWA